VTGEGGLDCPSESQIMTETPVHAPALTVVWQTA
jgi:hypothetical protein